MGDITSTARYPAASDFLQAHPKRPDGNRWRTVELSAAQGRAQGLTWGEIGHNLGLQKDTVESYTRREWWDTAYNWFMLAHQRFIHAKQDEEYQRQRDAWIAEDAELTKSAVQHALISLSDITKGKRPIDALMYMELRGKGVAPESAELQARAGQDVPSSTDRVAAARTILRATGYIDMKKELSRMAVDEMKKAREFEGGERAADIDVSISGVDV